MPNSSNIITNVNSTISIKGTGKAIGLTTGTTNFGLMQGGSGGIAYTVAYDKNIGASPGVIGLVDSGIVIGITTDSSKSGITGTLIKTQLNCIYIIKY